MNNKSKILFLVAGLLLVAMAVLRFLVGVWMPFMWVLAIVAGLLILASMWLDRKIYIEFFSTKTTKQGLSMGSMILLVFVFLTAVNAISVRKYKTFDFSASKVNTLSDQSVHLLKGLKEDLKVLYFYQTGAEGVEENRRAFTTLIKKYQDQSDRIKLDFIEVNERPDLAEEYGVNRGSGVVFVNYQGRKSKIDKIDEQDLTGALVKVTRENSKKVYFTTGHGEYGLEDSKDAMGANSLKLLLEGNRYLVGAVNLTQMPDVPTDADLLVVLGPSQSFLTSELDAIERYLRKGGAALLALNAESTTGLNPLLEKIGIAFDNNMVVQVMETALGKAVNPTMTPVSEFSVKSPITKPFGDGQFVVMRLPANIRTIKTYDYEFEPLLTLSKNALSFADKTFKTPVGQPPYQLGYSIKGKLPGSDQNFTAIVFSDAEFIGNQLLYQNLNRDLLLNSVAYLAKEESIISITPKEVGITQLDAANPQFQFNFYLFVFTIVLPIPLVLLTISGVLWYRRRYV